MRQESGGQFAIKSWTAAALAGIGFTLIDLNTILKTLTPLYLITVVLIVGIITLTASVLGKLVGFFPLESAIAAGMCTTNMGGSGNVAVLSSAHRMELLPFAQIVTRSCGALMLTIGGTISADGGVGPGFCIVSSRLLHLLRLF